MSQSWHFAVRERPGISRTKNRQQLRRAKTWSDLNWRRAMVASLARTNPFATRMKARGDNQQIADASR